MGNMRTLAFQVPEELFQKIKDYLKRNNMTQKEFVLGLIEDEIERDLTQRAAALERSEATAVGAFEGSSSDESEDLDNDPDEYENQGMSMGMRVKPPCRNSKNCIRISARLVIFSGF